MTGDIVIRAEGLGKKYVIGHETERERYVALRDVLVGGAKNLWRKTADAALGRPLVLGDTVEEVWALKDVSFEVRRGEVLGIIGRNGAGKSTLLKILSRITEPSAGRAALKGRVASLLEVGTGFHPELTGRENIYLNGAILGMTRTEVKRNFDAIVAFAEVEKFLDTPVKRYSSGMYVRLAFAVAAHLEPEILFVDEVLAVGDAEFQKRCLGKIGEVAGGGRTVLFVSHNLAAVRALCERALLFQNGRLVGDDASALAIRQYQKQQTAATKAGGEWVWAEEHRPGDASFHLRKVSVTNETGAVCGELLTDEDFAIAIEYEQHAPLRGLRVSLQLVTAEGEIAFTTTDHSERTLRADGPGIRTSTCYIPRCLLNTGEYALRLNVDVPGVRVIIDWREIGIISVSGRHNGGTFFNDRRWPGVLSPRLAWTVRPTTLPEAVAWEWFSAP